MCRHTTIDLSEAGHGNFIRQKTKWFEAVWMLFEWLIITSIQPSSKLRAMVLRIFGAEVGTKVILRPRIRVKYPWNLTIGDNCWIGEGVWIHNQAKLTIENNVVISQDTFISTGSHDYKQSMNLVVKPCVIRSGAWITSRCIVTLDVEIGENALVTPGSVVNKSLAPNGIYSGNPAKYLKERWD